MIRLLSLFLNSIKIIQTIIICLPSFPSHFRRSRKPRIQIKMPREYAPAHRKRKSHDISDDADAAAAPGAGAGPRKKILLPKKEHKYPSVNELKKRIRDVKRLLNKADLPADARIVQERALSGYEKELEDELKRRDRSKMIKKYHFVRFLGMFSFLYPRPLSYDVLPCRLFIWGDCC